MPSCNVGAGFRPPPTQEFARHILRAHLAKGRLAHTYLVTGGGEEEKKELVFSFARSLNCERGSGSRTAPAFEDHCDCTSCRKVRKGTHPDVFALGRDEKAKSIKIEDVRQATQAASLKPYEGKWKVFILMGSERLTLESANALLKTLEEPPEHTIFVLLAGNKANLLETIQSRAFEIRLGPSDEGPAEKLWEGDTPPWKDFFEGYQTASRDEIKKLLDSMLYFFHGEQDIQAFDAIYETKDALEANVNQKLALTRLAMQLQKVPGTFSASEREKVPGTF